MKIDRAYDLQDDTRINYTSIAQLFVAPIPYTTLLPFEDSHNDSAALISLQYINEIEAVFSNGHRLVAYPYR